MNTDTGKRPALIHLAQIVSDIFSPILIPTYAYSIMMWLTPLVILPERVRLVTTAVIALITAVVPTASLLTLRRLGRISDAAVSRRNERLLPFALALVCYIGAAWYLGSVHAPWWAARFFLGAALAVAIALIITLKWKISAHTTAIAGMTGLIIWLAFRHLMFLQPMVVITVSIMLCGVVGSCRLALRRHTLAQTGAGFLLGIACTTGIMLI
ncbi:MAG: hypothetical protein K2L80_01975 [Muribaculaceae bacterium]|nr:hypothetical protein [Muribaculaceae bacterium]MDE6331347.1 hypothetical protein [Muribaculaceae bacterium]